MVVDETVAVNKSVAIEETVSVVVAVDKSVTVTRDDDETLAVITSTLLGEVGPVVRLNNTFPAGT